MINYDPEVDGSPSQRPKLSSRPKPYVDVNDLRQMLKLGLGLHTVGDRDAKLIKAVNGLAKLTSAQTWVATVLVHTGGVFAVTPVVLKGGTDTVAAQLAADRIAADCRRRSSPIGKFVATPNQVPGRVHAAFDEQHGSINSVLIPETGGREKIRRTWISIHRNTSATPFLERERRMVELFHSQTAWLLMQLAE